MPDIIERCWAGRWKSTKNTCPRQDSKKGGAETKDKKSAHSNRPKRKKGEGAEAGVSEKKGKGEKDSSSKTRIKYAYL